MNLMKRVFLLLVLLNCTIFAAGTVHVGFVYPGGGQRGTTFEIIVGGQQFSDVSGIYVSGRGVSGIIIGKVDKLPVDDQIRTNVKDQDQNQIAERVRIAVTVAKDAPLGVRDFRLTTKSGFSNRIAFDVGELPDISEKEPNDSYSEALKIESLPTTVNGQIMPGDRDVVRFSAKKGQQIVCSVKARELIPYLADAVPGWFQATLTLYDSKGKEVAYNDDFQLRPDPVIIFTVLKSGDYFLQIRDAIFRGRQDFVYRLSIGELPFIQSIHPLGGPKGEKVEIQLNGVNVGKRSMTVTPSKTASNRINFSTKGKGGLTSNKVFFATSEYEETKGHGNITKMMTAQLLEFPVIVNGNIACPGQENWFKVKGTKNDQIVFDVTSRRLGSPLDAEITIMSKSGRIWAKNDDFEDRSEGLVTHHADAHLIYKFRDDKDYFIRIRDIQGHGGKAFSYRLFVGPPRPDYDLRIEPSNLTISRQGTVPFTVHALRKDNFGGEIKLSLKDLPKGFKYSNNVIKAGQKLLRMTLTAPKDAKLGPLALKVIGTAQSDGKTISRKAAPAEEQMQAFLYLHLVPSKDFLATVLPTQPFSMQVVKTIKTQLILEQDKELKLIVKIQRAKGFYAPVKLVLNKPPAGVVLKTISIPKGKNEIEVTLVGIRIRDDLITNLVIMGTAKVEDKVAGVDKKTVRTKGKKGENIKSSKNKSKKVKKKIHTIVVYAPAVAVYCRKALKEKGIKVKK